MSRVLIRQTCAAVLLVCMTLLCAGCGGKAPADGEAPVVGDLVYESTVPLAYADQFAIYKYQGGYSLIDMVNSDRMLVVPEGAQVPEGLDRDIVVVQQPLSHIYLAATSAMALLDSIDALDRITFVGSRNWYNENAAQALKNGSFTYAGKYNAPDYEMLINGGCQLAIESTMILHNPEVKEKMLELGIKTVVERSSYEEHPLGRTEWVKVYGTMLGLEDAADAVFRAELEKVRPLESLAPTGKTVAFFFINSNGSVVTYKSTGYVSEMLRIAGGEYIFPDLGKTDESNLSTVNMNMEEFYNTAKDADVIIYNCSSMGAPLHTLAEFLSLNPVLEDFKAVEQAQVWCTAESMFQQTDKMGTIMQEMNTIFTGSAQDGELTYFFKLK